MKVTVKDKYLNVRVGEASINAPCYQYIAPGSELEVEDKLYKGDMYEGIDTWFKDAAGNYYWSGGVTNPLSIENSLELSKPGPDAKQTFEWFNKLNIQTIWDNFNEKGDKVKIAVLDTGIDLSNPDLTSAFSKTKIIITNSNYPGINLVIDDQSNDFHGTRCASLIGSRNQQQYTIGIAPQCNLIIGKISIAKEIRDFSYIINGIKWAIEEKAEIVSISYAYETLTQNEFAAFNQQVNELIAGKNILIFAACGNAGDTPITGDFAPAAFTGCISVGSSNRSGQVSSNIVISNRTVIHAPGEDIESYGMGSVPTPATGSSISTPIVAAVCGLAVSYLKKKNNTWDKKKLLEALYASADVISATGNKRRINPLHLFNQIK